MGRREDLDRLYQLLDELRLKLGGVRYLHESDGYMSWPERGVYFFFEAGEVRADGLTPRVVRVGTHAVTLTSKTSLWNRLAQHRGAQSGSGNHRGSIFRLHVGTALLNAQPDRFAVPRSTWGRGSSADHLTREAETELEHEVSRHIGAMPFLVLDVDDLPGPSSQRHVLESNMIALLSNARKTPIDPASPSWLGNFSDNAAIRESDLWNVNYVVDEYQAAALDLFEARVDQFTPFRM